MNEPAESVLDASAVLAALFKEAGSARVARALERGAAMSAVTAAEVAARLSHDGWTSEEVRVAIAELGIETVAFDHQTALLSGGYRPATRHLGLGLGDRACLATASRLGLPALTADRSWADVSIAGVTVVLIR